MKRADRTQAANDDLAEIAFQIGVVSGRPLTADAVIDDIIACCDRLADLAQISRLGTAEPRLGETVRLYSHKRWVILFRYVDNGVLVLRIADGSQDYLAWVLG